MLSYTAYIALHHISIMHVERNNNTARNKDYVPRTVVVASGQTHRLSQVGTVESLDTRKQHAYMYCYLCMYRLCSAMSEGFICEKRLSLSI